jgi:hypothetical protein
MSSDPYASTTTVKNIVQHVISPKIVNDGSGGYKLKTDLVNVDRIVAGKVLSDSTTTSSMVINAPMPTVTEDMVSDILINVNSGGTYVPRWQIAHKNPETGASSGSEFCIHGYNDAGVMTEAMNIKRSDFATTIVGSMTVNGNSITASNAAATVSTLNAITSILSPSITATTLSVPTRATIGNNLDFSTTGLTASDGTLQVNGKIVFTIGNHVDFVTGGNSASSTTAGGFLRMTDSAGGIGFGNGTTTGGVLAFGPNSTAATAVSGFLAGPVTHSSGTTTFGTNSTSLNGNAVFNNLQAGTLTITTSTFGTVSIPGLNSGSIVTVTPRNTGSVYGGGAFSVDTSVADTLCVYVTTSGTYSFNYFVSRF